MSRPPPPARTPSPSIPPPRRVPRALRPLHNDDLPRMMRGTSLMPVRTLLVSLLAAGALAASGVAWAAGPGDRPQGPPASTPAPTGHAPESTATPDHGDSA